MIYLARLVEDRRSRWCRRCPRCFEREDAAREGEVREGGERFGTEPEETCRARRVWLWAQRCSTCEFFGNKV